MYMPFWAKPRVSGAQLSRCALQHAVQAVKPDQIGHGWAWVLEFQPRLALARFALQQREKLEACTVYTFNPREVDLERIATASGRDELGCQLMDVVDRQCFADFEATYRHRSRGAGLKQRD